jgi:pyruvate/2-oxoglutarate dehydrogenase complex dihydrolipoamide dehydrogenase (E3) component
MRRTVASLVRLAEQSGAEIHRGVEAKAEDIAALEPDVAIVATGADPIIPKIPGLDRALTGEEVLSGSVNADGNALIIGGGLVGIEVAEFLAQRGGKVVVVEMLAEIARDMEPITRKLTLKRLAELPVDVLTRSQVTGVAQDGSVTVEGPEGEQTLGPFDNVVVAVGTRSHDELSSQLIAKDIEVYVVGDAAELAQVQGAVRSAWEVARTL